jgi:hypothetical protein
MLLNFRITETQKLIYNYSEAIHIISAQATFQLSAAILFYQEGTIGIWNLIGYSFDGIFHSYQSGVLFCIWFHACFFYKQKASETLFRHTGRRRNFKDSDL